MNLCPVLFCGFTDFQQVGAIFFLHTLSNIYCCRFSMMIILTCVRQCPIVFLIHSSLIFRDAEHLFICFMAISMSSLEKDPFKSCAPVWVVSLISRCISCSYVLEINSCGCLCLHIIVPLWGLSFCRVYGFLCCASAFKWDWVPFIYFCFIFHVSKRWVKEKLATFYVKVYSAFFLKNFILSVLLFGSLIYLEFIFVYTVREYSNFILIAISKKTPAYCSS